MKNHRIAKILLHHVQSGRLIHSSKVVKLVALNIHNNIICHTKMYHLPNPLRECVIKREP